MARTVSFCLSFALLASLHAADVRTETWTEKWPDTSEQIQTIGVTAEVWTAAFQAELDRKGSLHIPARDRPYYIDGPLILKSGQRLTADPNAEIRLKPGCNTCMVRNAKLVGFKDGPVPQETEPDTDSFLVPNTVWIDDVKIWKVK